MRQRSVPMVLVLSIITLGLYAIYWLVSTKNEMNRLGAQIPTAWMLLLSVIPLIGLIVFYWYWKYCEGVEQVTQGKMSGPVAFLMLLFLSVIGMMIIQSKFNQVAANQPANLPQAHMHAG